MLLLRLLLLRQDGRACGRHYRQAKTACCDAAAESMHGASPYTPRFRFHTEVSYLSRRKAAARNPICSAITLLLRRCRSFDVHVPHQPHGGPDRTVDQIVSDAVEMEDERRCKSS
jgi:hypothetical protein